MREILFRGKRRDNGEWIIGYYLVVDGISYILPEKCFLNGIVEVDLATVSQYTGLTDKNGVKIFEGDILLDEIRVRRGKNNEWIYRHPKYVVCFQGGSFCLQTIYKRVVSRLTHRLSVIGNIHDSPKFFIQED